MTNFYHHKQIIKGVGERNDRPFEEEPEQEKPSRRRAADLDEITKWENGQRMHRTRSKVIQLKGRK